MLQFIFYQKTADFFHECLQVKNYKRNSFMIINVKKDQEDCFIACCLKFTYSEIQDFSKLDIDRTLTRNCFYFDNDVLF